LTQIRYGDRIRSGRVGGVGSKLSVSPGIDDQTHQVSTVRPSTGKGVVFDRIEPFLVEIAFSFRLGLNFAIALVRMEGLIAPLILPCHFFFCTNFPFQSRRVAVAVIVLNVVAIRVRRVVDGDDRAGIPAGITGPEGENRLAHTEF
jgi:hypothetical protein